MLSLFKDLKPEDRFVAFLATLIVGLFAAIAVASMFFPVRSDAEIKQTVIALVMLAAGFYLGSSASGRTKDKVIADMAAAPTPPVLVATPTPVVREAEPLSPTPQLQPETPAPAAPPAG